MSVHLFVRSCYTLQQSTVRIPALVHTAKEMGYTSVALTDHNVLFGAASFIHACESEGIHGIVGLEADVLYHDKVVPFVLLSQDNTGYQNLMKLSSILSSGMGPASFSDFLKYAGHCALIAYGEGGYFETELVNDDNAGVMAKLAEMKKELPPFDVALSYHDSSLWHMKNLNLKTMCRNSSIRTLALSKVYYMKEEDADTLMILTGICRGTRVSDNSLTVLKGRHFLSPSEMAKIYDKDDLDRTDEIAASCKADYQLEKTSLPAFHVKEPGITSEQYLKALCAAGLKKRLHGNMDPEYVQRLKYELSIILKMHFADYFLIVYDFIRYARKKGINVGPGRGSAAGSLVAYVLGITMIDPVKYNLLCGRFLNPSRVTMPDIDTDIPDNRRAEVIQYVYETYGADHIANVVTFSTFGAKAVCHDVGKVLGMSAREIELVTRQIPNTAKVTLRDAYQSSQRLREIIASDDKYKTLFSYALKLEGLPRHTSIHAAGIIMSSKNVNDVIPTIQLEEGMRTSQYPKEYLEERGLIKMDFLGVRNLSIIAEIVEKIQKKEPDFALSRIDLNDPAVYQVFAKADTLGIFQFESEGMKALLQQMKPQKYEDLVAALALYRPSAKDSIPLYLENRAHPERIRYPSLQLKPILQETYGIMIYQEQTMLVSQAAAGFSLAKADILRKAISKKNPEEMDKLGKDFVQGAVQNGYPQKTAESLFALIRKFGGYGFNKSHAVAYGLVSYQMAYLKARYPLDFYCALLNGVNGDQEKTSQYVDECRRRGIRIKAPDVNLAGNECVQNGNEIILPFSLIKGIGSTMAETLKKERDKNGPYEDFFQFVVRANAAGIALDQIESMIDAGCFDCFGKSRNTWRQSMDNAMKYADLVLTRRNGQISFDFSLISPPSLTLFADNEDEKMERERTALGFNLGAHPIIRMREANQIKDPPLAVLKNKRGKYDGFAQIRNVHTHRTRKGEMMAFVKLSDETGEADMAVMPALYQRTASFLMKGVFIRFNAKIEDERSFLANRIEQIKRKGN